MALARENAHVKIANVRWVRGAGFEEARCDAEADLHSRWHRQREDYRYANEEYCGPRMGGFPQIPCLIIHKSTQIGDFQFMGGFGGRFCV